MSLTEEPSKERRTRQQGINSTQPQKQASASEQTRPGTRVRSPPGSYPSPPDKFTRNQPENNPFECLFQVGLPKMVGLTFDFLLEPSEKGSSNLRGTPNHIDHFGARSRAPSFAKQNASSKEISL